KPYEHDFLDSDLAQYAQLLVDDAHAEFSCLTRTGRANLLSINEVLTGIAGYSARQDFDQRGLARSVFSRQAEHLPPVQLERNIFEYLNRAERFRHMGQLDERLRGW